MTQARVLVVGSVAIDWVITEAAERPESVGGSGTFFAMAASYLAPVRLVGVVGKDFPAQAITDLARRAVMLMGTMLAILDSSILNILVAPIMGEFQTDLRSVEWVLTSYNLAFAVFLIGFGSLGDMMGRRRLHVLGQVVFVVGSGLAALASGPTRNDGWRAGCH